MASNFNATKTEMSRKVERYTQLNRLYSETEAKIATDPSLLIDFLDFMTRNAHLSYRNAVVAFASKPDAEYLHTYDEWNNTYGRKVRGKGVGVLVFGNEAEYGTGFVFAEANTEFGKKSTPLPDFNAIDESALANVFANLQRRDLNEGALDSVIAALPAGSTVFDMVEPVARLWVAETAEVFADQLRYQFGERGIELQQIASDALTYAICSRLGVKTEFNADGLVLNASELASICSLAQLSLGLVVPSIEKAVLQTQLGQDLPQVAVQVFHDLKYGHAESIIDDDETSVDESLEAQDGTLDGRTRQDVGQAIPGVSAGEPARSLRSNAEHWGAGGARQGEGGVGAGEVSRSDRGNEEARGREGTGWGAEHHAGDLGAGAQRSGREGDDLGRADAGREDVSEAGAVVSEAHREVALSIENDPAVIVDTSAGLVLSATYVDGDETADYQFNIYDLDGEPIAFGSAGIGVEYMDEPDEPRHYSYTVEDIVTAANRELEAVSRIEGIGIGAFSTEAVLCDEDVAAEFLAMFDRVERESKGASVEEWRDAFYDALVEHVPASGPAVYQSALLPTGWTWVVSADHLAQLTSPSDVIVFDARGADSTGAFSFRELVTSTGVGGGAALDALFTHYLKERAYSSFVRLGYSVDNIEALAREIKQDGFDSFYSINVSAPSFSDALSLSSEFISSLCVDMERVNADHKLEVPAITPIPAAEAAPEQSKTEEGQELAGEKVEEGAAVEEAGLSENVAEVAGEVEAAEEVVAEAEAETEAAVVEAAEEVAEPSVYDVAVPSIEDMARVYVPGFDYPLGIEDGAYGPEYILSFGKSDLGGAQSFHELAITRADWVDPGEASWQWEVRHYTFVGGEGSRPYLQGKDTCLWYEDGKLTSNSDAMYATPQEAFVSFAMNTNLAKDNKLGIDFEKAVLDSHYAAAFDMANQIGGAPVYDNEARAWVVAPEYGKRSVDIPASAEIVSAAAASLEGLYNAETGQLFVPDVTLHDGVGTVFNGLQIAEVSLDKLRMVDGSYLSATEYLNSYREGEGTIAGNAPAVELESIGILAVNDWEKHSTVMGFAADLIADEPEKWCLADGKSIGQTAAAQALNRAVDYMQTEQHVLDIASTGVSADEFAQFDAVATCVQEALNELAGRWDKNLSAYAAEVLGDQKRFDALARQAAAYVLENATRSEMMKEKYDIVLHPDYRDDAALVDRENGYIIDACFREGAGVGEVLLDISDLDGNIIISDYACGHSAVDSEFAVHPYTANELIEYANGVLVALGRAPFDPENVMWFEGEAAQSYYETVNAGFKRMIEAAPALNLPGIEGEIKAVGADELSGIGPMTVYDLFAHECDVTYSVSLGESGNASLKHVASVVLARDNELGAAGMAAWRWHDIDRTMMGEACFAISHTDNSINFPDDNFNTFYNTPEEAFAGWCRGGYLAEKDKNYLGVDFRALADEKVVIEAEVVEAVEQPVEVAPSAVEGDVQVVTISPLLDALRQRSLESHWIGNDGMYFVEDVAQLEEMGFSAADLDALDAEIAKFDLSLVIETDIDAPEGDPIITCYGDTYDAIERVLKGEPAILVGGQRIALCEDYPVDVILHDDYNGLYVKLTYLEDNSYADFDIAVYDMDGYGITTSAGGLGYEDAEDYESWEPHQTYTVADVAEMVNDELQGYWPTLLSLDAEVLTDEVEVAKLIDLFDDRDSEEMEAIRTQGREEVLLARKERAFTIARRFNIGGWKPNNEKHPRPVALARHAALVPGLSELTVYEIREAVLDIERLRKSAAVNSDVDFKLPFYDRLEEYLVKNFDSNPEQYQLLLSDEDNFKKFSDSLAIDVYVTIQVEIEAAELAATELNNEGQTRSAGERAAGTAAVESVVAVAGDTAAVETVQTFNFQEFLDNYHKEYDFLYENDRNGSGIGSYNDDIDAGDAFIRQHPEFVGELVKFRGDPISSDREVAAFIRTLESMGLNLDQEQIHVAWEGIEEADPDAEWNRGAAVEAAAEIEAEDVGAGAVDDDPQGSLFDFIDDEFEDAGAGAAVKPSPAVNVVAAHPVPTAKPKAKAARAEGQLFDMAALYDIDGITRNVLLAGTPSASSKGLIYDQFVKNEGIEANIDCIKNVYGWNGWKTEDGYSVTSLGDLGVTIYLFEDGTAAEDAPTIKLPLEDVVSGIEALIADGTYMSAVELAAWEAFKAEHEAEVEDGALSEVVDEAEIAEVEAAAAAFEAAGGDAVEYYVADYDLLDAAPYEHVGPKARFARNIAAIKALRDVEARGGAASDAERSIMAAYVGWGGLADAFDENNTAWASEYAELKELLSESEYESARGSVLDSFYTPRGIVEAMYETLERFGMDGGNILDPCCGTGRFVGAATFDKSNTNMFAVDCDNLSARFTSALYPSATVFNAAYQDCELPDKSFDAVVSNSPFGEVAIYDGRYSNYRFTPHNYFFAKSLDMVRPGGIVAMITSRYFMDARTTKNREYMAHRAEFLGAVRLPETTFKNEAGTKAISDIVFLKRREDYKEILDEDDWAWVQTEEIERQGEELTVNSYFAANPEMVAGEIYPASSRFGTTVGVAEHEGVELEGVVRECLSRINGVYEPLMSAEYVEPTTGEVVGENIKAYPSIPNYSFGVAPDGKLYFRRGEFMAECSELSGKKAERVRAMVRLRDTFRELLSAERSLYSDPVQLVRLRRELNNTYDQFKKKFGYLNDRANKSAFAGDMSAHMILALENKNELEDTFEKADIFEKRVNFPQTPVLHVDTPDEALAVCMSTYGKVDLDYMSQLCGMSGETIMEQMSGKLFYEPLHDGMGTYSIDLEHVVSSSEFLSGLVKDKLAVAQAAGAYARLVGDDKLAAVMDAQATALEAAQPVDIPASDIAVEIGCAWLPVEYYEQFIYETFDIDWQNQRDGASWYPHITVDYDPNTSAFEVTNKGAASNTKINSEFGVPNTGSKSALYIFEDALNLRPSKVTYQVWNAQKGKEETVIDKEKTAIAQAKQEMIKNRFRDWVFADPERAEQLVRIYNDRFNVMVERHFDGSTVELHDANAAITLRDYQKEAVARQLYGKTNTLLYHVVGAGKTFTMAAASQEGKRMGLHNKALFVTPKAVVEQTAQQYSKLYPNANLLIATEKDFSKDNRQTFMARIAASNVDAVFMSNEQFTKIPMSPEYMRDYYAMESERITSLIAESHAREGSKKSLTTKKLEQYKKRIEAELKRAIAEVDKDTGNVTFEELGIDRVFIDEAHKYKNLKLETSLKVKGGAGGDSNRAQDMLMKVRYLNETYGEGRVTFATGTAVSNTMVELYVMQRYLQPDLLEKMGLQTFTAWASVFGKIENSLEFTPDQRFAMTQRFAKFQNLPELMNVFREIADIRTDDMVNLDLPECDNITVEAEATEFQKEYIQQLSKRSDKIANREVAPYEDNMLKITYEGRYLAADPRSLDIDYPAGNKSMMVADNVLKLYREHADTKAAQLVFSDVSAPDAMMTVHDENGEAVRDVSGRVLRVPNPYSIYRDIRQQLIDGGIPENEIAFVHDFKPGKGRDELYEKVRKGEVRVLFGSTEMLGTGVNVQDRLIAIHNVDCPWRPSDLEQRRGRLVRQGNTNSHVYNFRYVTKGTFDTFLYQSVEKKQRGIGQVFTSKSPMRSMDDIDEAALDYAEVKAAAAGDPRVQERMQLQNNVDRMKIEYNAFNQARLEAAKKLDKLPALIEPLRKQLEAVKVAVETRRTFDEAWESADERAAYREALVLRAEYERVVAEECGGNKMMPEAMKAHAAYDKVWATVDKCRGFRPAGSDELLESSEEAGKAIMSAAMRFATEKNAYEVGEYRGFTITAKRVFMSGSYDSNSLFATASGIEFTFCDHEGNEVIATSSLPTSTTPTMVIYRLNGAIEGLDKRIPTLERDIAKYEKDLEIAAADAERAYPDQAAYDEARDKLALLNAALNWSDGVVGNDGLIADEGMENANADQIRFEKGSGQLTAMKEISKGKGDFEGITDEMLKALANPNVDADIMRMAAEDMCKGELSIEKFKLFVEALPICQYEWDRKNLYRQVRRLEKPEIIVNTDMSVDMLTYAMGWASASPDNEALCEKLAAAGAEPLTVACAARCLQLVHNHSSVARELADFTELVETLNSVVPKYRPIYTMMAAYGVSADAMDAVVGINELRDYEPNDVSFVSFAENREMNLDMTSVEPELLVMLTDPCMSIYDTVKLNEDYKSGKVSLDSFEKWCKNNYARYDKSIDYGSLDISELIESGMAAAYVSVDDEIGDDGGAGGAREKIDRAVAAAKDVNDGHGAPTLSEIEQLQAQAREGR